MHSSVLQELALKCRTSGNVSSLENVFHSYFGWQGCVPVGIPQSGIKSALIFLWNERKKQNSPSRFIMSLYTPQNQPLGTEVPGGWKMLSCEHFWFHVFVTKLPLYCS